MSYFDDVIEPKIIKGTYYTKGEKMTYDNKNTIIVFKNDKGENPKRPDYTGTVNIEGKEYALSMWTKNGRKWEFWAGPIEPKEKVFKEAKAAAQPEFQDDIPFARHLDFIGA